jgi:hypothetical protein
MNTEQSVESLLSHQLQNPLSSFSIGSFGAIAEFQRNPSEQADIDVEDSYSVVTARGAIKIELHEKVQAVAYENLSKHPERWRNGIVFCLTQETGKSRRRKVLTELGPDWSAIRLKDQNAVLFDVGLNSTNVDFCFRTADEKLLDILRRAEGRSVLDPENPVMGEIIAASPHRVAISQLGRIEVYQRIPTDQTLEGPHTHVLPKLLRTGRTHSANVPVPPGYLPCLSCYPANPLCDSIGNEVPFDSDKFQNFISILDQWRLPEYLKEKRRVFDAIGQAVSPADYQNPALDCVAQRCALHCVS